MVPHGQEWWTEEKVEATVTKHFVYTHLRANDAERLTDAVFADLSDKTYLECILEKARRLFLILVNLGVSGDILRLIEDSYDDENLPIDADDVTSLRLSRLHGQQIDLQFYRCQFKYLVRVVGEGEHIRYAQDERVPLHKVEQKAIGSQHVLEKVKLPSPVNQVFQLKRIHLHEDKSEMDILSEIAGTKTLSHEHTLSIFGSFVHNGHMHILLSPAAKYTLGQFLNDRPKSFEALPKPERRSHYVIWPHCLASALAWLHSHGTHHGAVRPSRILIDEHYQISLGQFEGDWVLGSVTQNGDLESYQYAAPELWKRGLTVQAQSFSGTNASFGGRSAFGRREASRQYTEIPRRSSEYDAGAQTGAFSIAGEKAYTFVPKFKGVSSRLRLEIAADNGSSPAHQLGRSDSYRHYPVDSPIDSIRGQHSLYHRYGPNSVRSSSSSENNRPSGQSRSERLYSMPSEIKNTAIQTWRSTANDLPATDVFGLAAVTIDMLTVLCSRTVSSFSKHRASKNRQAGRGGGLADSSFHANLPQVGTWAELLHKDAEKKIRKNSGDVFRAVGPILQVMLQCLAREPQKRASVSSLSQRLKRHLADFGDFQQLHCSSSKHKESYAGSRSLATIAPGAVESSIRKQSHAIRQPLTLQTNQRLQDLQEDQVSTSKASESSPDPYTPTESYVTTATHQESLPTSDARKREYQADPYLLCDEDLQKADAYYVQVMPKERSMVRRLHKDFTEQGSSSRGTSLAPSFTTATTTATTSQHNDSSPRNLGIGNTVHSNRTSYGTLSYYPPASPPPNRQLPPSPSKEARVRSQAPARATPAPLQNVYEANDLLAGTLRDMSLDERLSYASTTSTYLHLNVDGKEDDWILTKRDERTTAR